MDGLARFPREKKTHKYYSLVYPQSGWRIQVREARAKSGRRLVLRLSGLGVFKVIAHRDFPLESEMHGCEIDEEWKSVCFIHS